MSPCVEALRADSLLRAALFGLVSFALACDPVPGGKAEIDTASLSTPDEDADNDGFPASEDCNDGDPATHPGGVEICDGIDNNCDGAIDEGVTTTFFPDTDGDGFGDEAAGGTEACAASAGLVTTVGDCDDSDPAVHPEADEACNGVDDDCDAEIDEDVGPLWYPDSDSDGHGDPARPTQACDAPAGQTSGEMIATCGTW